VNVDVAHGRKPVAGGATSLWFKTGVMVAALLAVWIGLMALAVANIAADANTGVNAALKLNSGIGPYSGKEVVWLAAWFISWPVLHIALRNRDLNLKKWFGAFLVGVLIAVLLVWPAIAEAIADLV